MSFGRKVDLFHYYRKNKTLLFHMDESKANSPPNTGSKRFLSDDQGSPSCMRLMSMLALVVAAFLATVQVFEWGSDGDKTELILYFLVAAFAPKAVQKFAEK